MTPRDDVEAGDIVAQIGELLLDGGAIGEFFLRPILVGHLEAARVLEQENVGVGHGLEVDE
jgi:hypothetical protein